MKFYSALAKALLLSLTLAGAAHAGTIFTTTDSLAATDPIQFGRLSRNSIAQDWSGTETYPGIINPTVQYHYRTYLINVGLTPYIQISIDTTAATTFFSAYQTAYNPSTPASFAIGWLGDAGASGNFDFGGGGFDTRFFQVVAQLNSQLVLVVNESATNGGLNFPFTILVEGFTDTAFGEPSVTAVPEPSTIALLLAPLALFAVRRRKTVA